jgi:hypothetical protein
MVTLGELKNVACMYDHTGPQFGTYQSRGSPTAVTAANPMFTTVGVRFRPAVSSVRTPRGRVPLSEIMAMTTRGMSSAVRNCSLVNVPSASITPRSTEYQRRVKYPALRSAQKLRIDTVARRKSCVCVLEEAISVGEIPVMTTARSAIRSCLKRSREVWATTSSRTTHSPTLRYSPERAVGPSTTMTRETKAV